MATFNYNPANDKAYQAILDGYKTQQAIFDNKAAGVAQGYQAMIDSNRSVGESDRLALYQKSERDAAAAQQSMVSRGLGNTSALDSAQRGIKYDTENLNINLNDSIAKRQTDLQQSYLGFQSQAASQSAALGSQSLDYQGQALGQRYGAEANYVSQVDLANQQAKLGYTNQSALAANQQNYALQTMRAQQQFQDSQQAKYGYY